LLLASRKDRILQTYGGSLAFFPRSVSAYMRQRRRMEFDERKARMHVAEHDAYVRQTLAFSGDTV